MGSEPPAVPGAGAAEGELLADGSAVADADGLVAEDAGVDVHLAVTLDHQDVGPWRAAAWWRDAELSGLLGYRTPV